jgi:hypothetical protein
MQIVSYEASTEPWSALLTVLHIAEHRRAVYSGQFDNQRPVAVVQGQGREHEVVKRAQALYSFLIGKHPITSYRKRQGFPPGMEGDWGWPGATCKFPEISYNFSSCPDLAHRGYLPVEVVIDTEVARQLS